nr:transposase [Haemonchus contortus]
MGKTNPMKPGSSGDDCMRPGPSGSRKVFRGHSKADVDVSWSSNAHISRLSSKNEAEIIERVIQKQKRSGDGSLKDEKRVGRPSLVDHDVLLRAVEEDRRQPLREIEKKMGVSHTVVAAHLKLLELVKKLNKIYAEMSEKSEDVEMPPTSSSKDHEYSNTRNALEKRQSLYYDDPRTGRTFRFLLHRKNTRKADIYTCAKCKSRRKYVRIMVRNDNFLSDPASLDHICYMNATELKQERIRMEERKRRKRNRLPPYDLDDILEAEAYLYPKGSGTVSDEGCVISSAPSSPNSPAVEDVSEGARLKELVKTETESVLEKTETSSTDDPAAAGCSQAQMSGKIKDEQQDRTIVHHSKEEARSMMTPVWKDEPQTSEQEPSESQPSPRIRDDAFLESIKLALESIPPENRQKAHVDILRYIYTTIFDRYVDQ